jgi:hypothetical protein
MDAIEFLQGECSKARIETEDLKLLVQKLQNDMDQMNELHKKQTEDLRTEFEGEKNRVVSDLETCRAELNNLIQFRTQKVS